MKTMRDEFGFHKGLNLNPSSFAYVLCEHGQVTLLLRA